MFIVTCYISYNTNRLVTVVGFEHIKLYVFNDIEVPEDYALRKEIKI